jgi:hypothetical protein
MKAMNRYSKSSIEALETATPDFTTVHDLTKAIVKGNIPYDDSGVTFYIKDIQKFFKCLRLEDRKFRYITLTESSIIEGKVYIVENDNMITV